MSSYETGNNELRQCPYDPNHKVSVTRFAGHLVKCAASQKTAVLLICPFFAGHRVRREDFIQHVTEQCEYMEQSLLEGVLRKFRDNQTQSTEPVLEGAAGPTAVRIDPKTGQEYWD